MDNEITAEQERPFMCAWLQFITIVYAFLLYPVLLLVDLFSVCLALAYLQGVRRLLVLLILQVPVVWFRFAMARMWKRFRARQYDEAVLYCISWLPVSGLIFVVLLVLIG